jgi:hypothetical protein
VCRARSPVCGSQEDLVKKRLISYSALVFVLLTGALPVHASSPFIKGHVSMLELCPQDICHAAIFTGTFVGRVSPSFFSIGTITVAATHESPLPDVDQTKFITGGKWSLRLLSGRTISGTVTTGTIFNKGDNLYDLDVEMLITSNGSGTLFFEGELSHQVFPPTLIGDIFQ